MVLRCWVKTKPDMSRAATANHSVFRMRKFSAGMPWHWLSCPFGQSSLLGVVGEQMLFCCLANLSDQS